MAEENKKEVVIKGLDIPFWDLVVFLIKLSLASIPALFILGLVYMLLGMIFGAFMFPGNQF